jgi:hypothetical protein
MFRTNHEHTVQSDGTKQKQVTTSVITAATDATLAAAPKTATAAVSRRPGEFAIGTLTVSPHSDANCRLFCLAPPQKMAISQHSPHKPGNAEKQLLLRYAPYPAAGAFCGRPPSSMNTTMCLWTLLLLGRPRPTPPPHLITFADEHHGNVGQTCSLLQWRCCTTAALLDQCMPCRAVVASARRPEQHRGAGC